MKLLFVQNSLGTGGAERSQFYLWKRLQDESIPFSVLVLEHREEGIENQVLDSGIEVCFLGGMGFSGQVMAIRKKIREMRPDIVHSLLHDASIRVRMLGVTGREFLHVESLVNTPYAPIRLQDPNLNRGKLEVYRLIDRLTCRFGTDFFHAISQAVKDHYVDQVRLSKGKIKVIYRGRRPVSLSSEKPLKALEGYGEILPGDFIMINVGRQEFQKGQRYLLEAMALLKKGGNARVKLIQCGRKGSATAELERICTENGLENQVFFMGHVKDIHSLLACADLFVFPSLYEGLGGALIEAQAASLPVLASDIPAIREINKVGENSILVTPGRAELLKGAILELMSNPEKLQLMGEASRDHFQHHFHLDNVNRQMISWYESLLN